MKHSYYTYMYLPTDTTNKGKYYFFDSANGNDILDMLYWLMKANNDFEIRNYRLVIHNTKKEQDNMRDSLKLVVDDTTNAYWTNKE